MGLGPCVLYLSRDRPSEIPPDHRNQLAQEQVEHQQNGEPHYQNGRFGSQGSGSLDLRIGKVKCEGSPAEVDRILF